MTLAHLYLTKPLLLQIPISTGDVYKLDMQSDVTPAPARVVFNISE